MKKISLLFAVALLVAGLLSFKNAQTDPELPKAVAIFAKANGLTARDYPQSLLELLARNPETETFVAEYPIAKNKRYEIDLSDLRNTDTVPLLMQWDPRWGYIKYGSDVAGLTGCGPVCLSMAGIYLTGDTEKFSPDKMLRFATENGYCVTGHGTSWTLISEGGGKLGLDVTELPLDENRIRKNLTVGNPVICCMGPGDFTTSGHYIVLVACEDGGFRVNDPNSRENSQKLWPYEKISGQIRNLWAIRRK